MYGARNKQTKKDKSLRQHTETQGRLSEIRTWIFIYLLAKKKWLLYLTRQNFRCTRPYFFFLLRYSREVTLYQREAKKKKENVRKSRALTDQLLHSAHKNISTPEPDTKSGLKMLTTICRHNVRWQSTNTSFPSSEWRGGLAAVPEKTEYEGVAMYRTVSKTRKKKTTDEEKQ